MPDLVLAIDLGSSWCKAAYMDRAGTFAATGRSYTRPILPARDGMLEQLWETVITAVRAAHSQLSHAAHPAAIALSCRSLFGACLDHAGQAFWPAWDAELSKHSPDIRRAYSPEIWGDTDPYAFGYGTRLAGTVLWLQRTRPAEWRRIARIGALHDYIVYRMTGAWVTDPCTGPGPTGWPHEIVEITGLPPDALPRTLEPHELAGGLMADAAAALGLPAGTSVVVGLHDGPAANLGVRAIRAGDCCLTLGTNFVFRAATGARLTTHCFCYSVAPGSWAWVNNVPISSTQLDIVARSLQEDVPEVAERHLHLGRLADRVAPGAEGLVMRRIVPGQEEILRETIRRAQGDGYGEGVIYRAMVEAIAFGVRDLVNTAKRDGVAPRRFVATGGSAQNRAFLKVLSAVLNTPIEIGEPEAGLIGAGIVAAVGSNWYAALEQAMAAMTSAHPVVQPDPDAVAYYCDLDGSVYRSQT